ncbi:MAG: Rpn family recombination-promoting nuclease/putative transposase [Clostridia bacterium]|nr:Rpn family recombination-promoting nuclease/putative transposase [Clostridia bacterium]
MIKNSMEKLSIKNDFVFKKLFSKKGNEEYLIQFLSGLLNLEIKRIEIEHDVALEINLEDKKLGILDIKATLNDDTCVDIEMQRSDEKNIVKRSTFYASKLVSEQLSKSQEYKLIKPVIVIFIMDFNYFPFEEYITKSMMVTDLHREYELNNNVIYYYIELPKFRDAKVNMKDITSQWLTFIDGEKKKELEKVMENNNLIKKADEELEYLSGDAEIRRIAELRDKYVRDMKSAKSDGYEDGEKAGVKQGVIQEKINIAKNMLKEKIDIKIISRVTGLSEDEIKNIK